MKLDKKLKDLNPKEQDELAKLLLPRLKKVTKKVLVIEKKLNRLPKV